MTNPTKNILLIHGPWHHGRLLTPLADHLTAAGHYAIAPTLPGHQPNESTRHTTTFNDYINHLATTITTHYDTHGPVTLFAHSSAALLIQAAVPHILPLLEQLIFNNPILLPSGLTQFDLISSTQPELVTKMRDAAAHSGDNCIPVLPNFMRHVLMPTEPPHIQDQLLTQFVPQPLPLFTTPVNPHPLRQLTLPKTLLLSTADRSAPYLTLAENLGPYTHHPISGGHLSLITQPTLFATTLLDLIDN